MLLAGDTHTFWGQTIAFHPAEAASECPEEDGLNSPGRTGRTQVMGSHIHRLLRLPRTLVFKKPSLTSLMSRPLLSLFLYSRHLVYASSMCNIRDNGKKRTADLRAICGLANDTETFINDREAVSLPNLEADSLGSNPSSAICYTIS